MYVGTKLNIIPSMIIIIVDSVEALLCFYKAVTRQIANIQTERLMTKKHLMQLYSLNSSARSMRLSRLILI